MRSKRIRTGFLAALATLAATGAAAAAPIYDIPDTANYKGGQVSLSGLLASGAHCNVFGERVSCYDSAEVAGSVAALRGGIVPLASCSPGLKLWWDGPFAGATIEIFTYPGWTNLPVFWRNQASSWATGCRSGKLADFVNGGGGQISMGANQSQGSMPSGWNDRADSVYRG